MAKERISYFDNIKALLILLVVVGHFVNGLTSITDSHAVKVLADWIYTFHMPVFIFVSGLFGAHVYSKEKGFAVENVMLYVVLYLVFIMLSWVEHSLMAGEVTSFNPFYASAAPWYLLALALLSLTLPVFARMKPVWGLLLAVVLSVANGAWNQDVNFLAVSRTLTYLPAYLLGYYIGGGVLGTWVRNVREHGFTFGGLQVPFRALYGAAVLVLVGLLCAYYLLPDSYVTLIRHYSTGIHVFPEFADKAPAVPYLVWPLLRIAHCGLMLVIGWAVVMVAPYKNCGYLTTIGERTLQVYIGHMLVYYFYNHLQISDTFCPMFGWWPLACIAIGVALTCLLAAFPQPNAWVRSLKGWLKRISVSGDPTPSK